MTRLRGRAPRGERLLAKVPHGHWKTTTLIAALGVDGIRCSMMVDGAVNADIFETFVEKVLLRELSEGDVVVMDNLWGQPLRATSVPERASLSSLSRLNCFTCQHTVLI
jgi:hypothetical protein